MANNIVDQAKVAVALDGRDAETVLSELTDKTEQYTDALTKAFQAGDKIGMKNALKDLKETEKQMAAVKKQTFDVTKVMNNLNGASLKELKRAQTEISKELEKMTRGTKEYTDTAAKFQKVTAEINKVKAEMNSASVSSSKFGKSFSEIRNIFAGVGIAALAGKAISVIKNNFKEMVESTKAGADRFNFAMSAARSGVEYFYKTLSTGNWNNFLENIGKAIQAGYDYAEAMDEVNERTMALRMKEADMLKENVNLEIQLRNKTLSNEARLAAGKQRIKNEEMLTEERTKLATKDYNAQLNKLKSETSLNEQQLQEIAKYNNEQLRLKADQYNKLLEQAQDYEKAKSRASLMNTSTTGAMIVPVESDSMKKVKDEMAKFSPEVVTYAKALRQYGTATEEIIGNFGRAYVELKQAEVSGPENVKKVITKVNELEEQLRKEADDKREEAYKTALNALEINHRKELTLIKNRYADGLITEEAYNKAVESEDWLSLQARLALLKGYGKDTSEVENLMAESRIKGIKAKGKEEFDARKQIAADIAEMEKEFYANNTDKADNADAEQQALDASESISDAELEAMDARREFMNQYKRETLAEQYNMELEQIEKLSRSHEEYINAKTQLDAKYAAEYLSRANDMLNMGANMVTAFKDAELAQNEANKEKELSQLDEKHKRGLISDEVYSKKKNEVEEKYKKKENEIRKKYADKEFAFKVAQIIASTALAIMQAFATLGPIAGAIAAAILTATGAAQVAQANAERQKVKQLAVGQYNVTGATDGQQYNVPFAGSMKTGMYTRPVLVAERGAEMVIDNPTLRNIQFNAPDIIPRIMANRVRQYADGNYPAQSSSQSQANDDLKNVLAANMAVLGALTREIQKGIKTDFNISAFEDVKNQYDSLKNDVSKT